MVVSNLFALIIMVSLYFIESSNKGGLIIAIKRDIILEMEQKYLPNLTQQLGDLKLPDQQLDLDIKLTTIKVNLTNILFQNLKLDPKNVEIVLEEPNILKISASQISGVGSFHLEYSMMFSYNDTVSLTISNLTINAVNTLGSFNSSHIPGKKLPSAKITDIAIDIDFDFEIKGSPVAWFVTLLKKLIKSSMKTKIQELLQTKATNLSEKLITDYVDGLPFYFPILPKKTSLGFDYSLIDDPIIKDQYLIINSRGAIVDLKHQDAESAYEFPDNLPDIDLSGKTVQLILTDYSINTALYSLFISGLLNMTVTPSQIPSSIPMVLNTTVLDFPFQGISKHYGKDKLVRINCKADKAPISSIKMEIANASATGICQIDVETAPDVYEQALIFNTTLNASGLVNVEQQGKISGQLSSIQMSETKVLFHSFDLDIHNFEVLFNSLSNIAVPNVNDQFLINKTLTLPTIDGISFSDSILKVHDDAVKIDINPDLSLETNGNKTAEKPAQKKNLDHKELLFLCLN